MSLYDAEAPAPATAGAEGEIVIPDYVAASAAPPADAALAAPPPCALQAS